MGYPLLARILRRVGVSRADAHLADAQELFRRMMFNILVDNTDDHEKNHALLAVDLTAHRRLRVASAYDVLPSSALNRQPHHRHRQQQRHHAEDFQP